VQYISNNNATTVFVLIANNITAHCLSKLRVPGNSKKNSNVGRPWDCFDCLKISFTVIMKVRMPTHCCRPYQSQRQVRHSSQSQSLRDGAPFLSELADTSLHYF